MSLHSKQSIIGIYGAGGHGRETMMVVQRSMQACEEDPHSLDLVFIDDADDSEEIAGFPVLSWDHFLQRPQASSQVVLALGDGRVRARLAQRIQEADVRVKSVSDPSVIMLGEVKIGEGALLGPYVVITQNCRIGRFFVANIHCSISHDCVIGDFVTFAPGVRCNGNVIVEDFVSVGSGAVIKNGTPKTPLVIGTGAVIGMGAVVTKDVPPGAIVIGNPAREGLANA